MNAGSARPVSPGRSPFGAAPDKGPALPHDLYNEYLYLRIMRLQAAADPGGYLVQGHQRPARGPAARAA